MNERIKIAELERLPSEVYVLDKDDPGFLCWGERPMIEVSCRDIDDFAYALRSLHPLLRLARAAKADRDIAARLVRGEYSDITRYYKDRNPLLREVEEALEAFDWN